MTPLKEVLETTVPASEPTVAQSNDRLKSDAGQLRSDAVSLDVPVKIHGSRVTDVVRGITSHTEPFEEQTATMIVFPQGGVLKMSTTVAVGQMLVLTNLKSGHDAICRIVKVRACAPSQSYVEIEFTNRQPGYWGVRFASDGPEIAQKSATLVPPAAPSASVAPSIASAVVTPSGRRAETVQGPLPISAAPAAASERVAQKAKPESSFVGIGSKEEVQPSAADTGSRAANRAVAKASSLSHASPSLSSLGSGVPGEMVETDEDRSSSADSVNFGGLATTPNLGTDAARPQPAFGSRYETGSSAQIPTTRKNSGKNWTLIGVAAAVLLALAAGAAFYAHSWSSEDKPIATLPAVPSAPTAALETGAGQNPGPDSTMQPNQANASVAPKAPGATTQAGEASSTRVGSLSSVAQTPPSTVNPRTSRSVSAMSSALNTHPKALRRTNSRDAVVAPSLDPGAASANDSGGLQQIGSSSALAPPAPIQPASNGPLALGGDVKQPRLIHSVMPVYPTVAKASRVEGSVVMETSIDANGNIAINKVISGPVLLRQAAIDAVSQWKYQPATLNGNPVAVKFTVTIQFHQ